MLLPALPSHLARSGGQVLGLRGRGDVEVSLVWAGWQGHIRSTEKGQEKGKDKAKGKEKGAAGGRAGGRVLAAELTVHSSHPWHAVPTHPNGPNGANTVGLSEEYTESGGGYFAWAGDIGAAYRTNSHAFPSSSTTGSLVDREGLVELTITHPPARKPLRLVSSRLVSNSDVTVSGVRVEKSEGCAIALHHHTNSSSSSLSSSLSLSSQRTGTGSGARPAGMEVEPTPFFSSLTVRISAFPCRILLCYPLVPGATSSATSSTSSSSSSSASWSSLGGGEANCRALLSPR